jgi:DNA-binding NtrC family response regulator
MNGPRLPAHDDELLPGLLRRLDERVCLRGRRLEQLVLGSLPWAEAAAVHAHLVDCLSCLNTFARLQSLHENSEPRPRLVRDSPSARAVYMQLCRLAALDEERGTPPPPVLVAGEIGTGKGLVAREIHALSHRAFQPFLEIGCAATPGSWLELELFGYERGAFPEATVATPGLFEVAEGGTLFLDEIEALPLDLQDRLLAAIKDRSVRRLGAGHAMSHDVRVIVATHVDLVNAVRLGTFRADLLDRFRPSMLTLPPLRERPDDIVPLARYFVGQFARSHGRAPRLTTDAEERLRRYRWPGNVRELSVVIERAARQREREEIGVDELGLPTS